MERKVTYTFELENGSRWEYQLTFDAEHRYIPPLQATVREWTRLDFNKCPHCPLQSATSAQCPVARNLDSVVEDSKATLSYTRAVVTVVTKERTYSKACATRTT